MLMLNTWSTREARTDAIKRNKTLREALICRRGGEAGPPAAQRRARPEAGAGKEPADRRRAPMRT